MQLSHILLSATVLALASSAPQGRRGPPNRRGPSLNRGPTSSNSAPDTRFFTGNQAIDSAAWGAALGAGAQYFGNQILNPCRSGGTRNTNRTPASGTNNRIFGNDAIGNGILGGILGFAGASVAQNALGNPCG